MNTFLVVPEYDPFSYYDISLEFECTSPMLEWNKLRSLPPQPSAHCAVEFQGCLPCWVSLLALTCTGSPGIGAKNARLPAERRQSCLKNLQGFGIKLHI